MKTRNDFVSNSSSCSFVVAIPKDYSIDSFIEDLVNDSVASRDDEPEDFVDIVRKSNRRNLDYHLNTTELLFLGRLQINDTIRTFKNEENEDGYNAYSEMVNCIDDPWLKEHPEQCDFIVEKRDNDEMTLRFHHFTSGITVSSEMMSYEIGRWSFAKEYTDEDKKRIAKNIYEYAALTDDNHKFTSWSQSNLFQVTKNTVMNTRDLIDTGYNVKLDSWEDLDKLEARIANGEKIFHIELANGGDGMSSNTIYGLGGWSANIGDNHAIQFLCSECG